MDYLLVLLSGFVEFTIFPLVACYQNILLNSLQLIGDSFYVTNRMWRATLTRSWLGAILFKPSLLCQHKQRHKKKSAWNKSRNLSSFYLIHLLLPMYFSKLSFAELKHTSKKNETNFHKIVFRKHWSRGTIPAQRWGEMLQCSR